MDLKRVEELIALMERSGVTQLSLELPEYKISITRGAQGAAEADTASAEVVEQPDEPEPEAVPPEAREALPVVSPVVGVFHNGGMLDPRVLLKEGDRVEAGQLVAAIEAMKVPNELRAPVSGMIARMLVEDGAAVEYGQPLFLIEPEEGEEPDEGESLVGLA